MTTLRAMKWLLSAAGAAALVAALSQRTGAAYEPPAGIELHLDEGLAHLGPGELGTFEIDGLERAVSARIHLRGGTAERVWLPPGLYGLRFVPDADARSSVGLALGPSVVLVPPRAVTRVNVLLTPSARDLLSVSGP